MNSNRKVDNRKNPTPSAVSLGLRVFMVYCLFHLALVSCTPVSPGPPPPQNNGPEFVINSPSEGLSVSGATFFSVQPFNANEVQSVSFTANGTELAVDAPGEDTFKVFLIPREFPDGELTLSAVVTGKDGSRSEKSVKVNVVGNPPSSATVTAEGALLGTQEESGAVSTLSIPAGAAEGAAVSFEARTKAEVKTETGIDYDALGVTFLGAQEISTTKSLDTPVAVSSGGFGPMVQPNQVVVNYTIAPDGDGDGIGELMVINTASVAPNGDVISDPVPQIQLGAATLTDSTGTQTLRSLQTGTISGPPGSRIELEVVGFNSASVFGNLAIFEAADGSLTEQPGTVFLNDDGSQSFITILPLINPGSAKLTLHNVATGASTSEISVNIEPLTPLSTPTVETIMNTLNLLKEAVTRVQEDTQQAGESVPTELSDLLASIAELETFITSNQNSAEPEFQNALSDLATLFVNAGINDLLQKGLNSLTSQGLSASGLCDPTLISAYRDIFTATGLAGAAILTVSVGILSVATGGLVVVAGAFLFGLGTAWTGGAVIGFLSLAFLGLVCPPPPCPTASQPPASASSSGSIRAQQTTPPNPMTGMGSAVPPGGDSCGSAVGGDPGASLRTSNGIRSLQNQLAGTTSLFGDLAGRFIVKVFFGGGSSVVPFTGISDSSGYFYIPFIPEGQLFEAIAFDTLTGQTRSFEGTGPATGQSTYMFFDFLSEGNSGANIIEYDTNTQGVLEGVDIFLFEGKAGDRINLAWFTEGEGSEFIGFHLTDANGRSIVGSNASFTPVGYHETGLVELELDGLYTFTLNSGSSIRNYTLGLAEFGPPTAINPGVPVTGNLATLGDLHRYTFTGKAGDTLEVTLSHDSSSSLNADLTLRDPLFGEAGLILNLNTDETRRTTTSGPVTLPIDGEYLLELNSGFFDALAQNLGGYQIDIVFTP
jgi:hypothetical protein